MPVSRAADRAAGHDVTTDRCACTQLYVIASPDSPLPDLLSQDRTHSSAARDLRRKASGAVRASPDPARSGPDRMSRMQRHAVLGRQSHASWHILCSGAAGGAAHAPVLLFSTQTHLIPPLCAPRTRTDRSARKFGSERHGCGWLSSPCSVFRAAYRATPATIVTARQAIRHPSRTLSQGCRARDVASRS